MKIFSHKRTLIILMAAMLVTTALMLSTASVSAAPPIQINFQDADLTDTPAGYLADTGLAYANRGNGQTYGWFTEASLGGVHIAEDAPEEGRDRDYANFAGDQRFDTLMHMQRTAGPNPNIAWEIAVPNGIYDVTVASGDEPNNVGAYDSTHVINVEGTNAYTFNATAINETIQATVRVTVADGNLTIDAVGGTNSKINWAIIQDIPDADGDGVPDATDNCVNDANPGQENNYPAPANSDAEGDVCDDTDTDTVLDSVDACPTVYGTLPNGCVDPTPADGDGDGVPDVSDACPAVAGVAPTGCPAVVTGNGPYNAPDDRFNWGAPGGNDVALYANMTDTSNPSVDAYCINDNSNGYFGLSISEDDLAMYPAFPEVNTLVASSEFCNLHFYILTSGQYQINMGPFSNNEVIEVIFDGLPPTNVRYSTFTDYSGGANVPTTPVSPASANSGVSTALSNCRVTTLDMLNFRETASADSAVLTMIPYDFTMDAIARTGDRFNVIFGDDNGWITADATFVDTAGNCD